MCIRDSRCRDRSSGLATETPRPVSYTHLAVYKRQVDDTAITTKVKAAVFNEPSLKSAEINVETIKGVVQLSGFVSSQSAANKATEVARGVAGVKSVKNDMRVK